MALELNGEVCGRNVLRVTRTDIPLTSRAIFILVGDQIKVKQEAMARRKTGPPPHRHVNTTTRSYRGSNSESSSWEGSDFGNRNQFAYPKIRRFAEWNPQPNTKAVSGQPNWASFSSSFQAPPPSKAWNSGPSNWKGKRNTKGIGGAQSFSHWGGFGAISQVRVRPSVKVCNFCKAAGRSADHDFFVVHFLRGHSQIFQHTHQFPNTHPHR